MGCTLGVARFGAYPVVSLEVVDLFPEHDRPDVFAEELDGVEGIDEAWAVAGEPGEQEVCQREFVFSC